VAAEGSSVGAGLVDLAVAAAEAVLVASQAAGTVQVEGPAGLAEAASPVEGSASWEGLLVGIDHLQWAAVVVAEELCVHRYRSG